MNTQNSSSFLQRLREEYAKHKQNTDKYLYPDGKKDIVSFGKNWIVPSFFIVSIYKDLSESKVPYAVIPFGIGLLLTLPFLKDFWISKLPFMAKRLSKYGLLFVLFSIGSLVSTPKTKTENTQTASTSNTEKENSKDEEMLAFINTYLQERNTDLCTVNEALNNIASESIKKADIKYPDFGAKHAEYSEELQKAETKKYFQKYGINDTLYTYIPIFGYTYCDKPKADAERAERVAQKSNFEENCLSSWNGSNRALVDYVKQNMNDPESFEHIETRYQVSGGYATLIMKFRGKNAFGGKVAQVVKAKVNLNDCSLIEVYE